MKIIKRYLNFLIGLLLVALSFNIFFSPNNLVPGGVSGLSVVIHKLTNLDKSVFIFVMNMILLGLSFLFLGKDSTKNTIIGSIILPIFLNLTNNLGNLFDLSNIDVLVQAVMGGFISGFGYGLVFKSGFTSGGTDILNQIISKYLKIPLSNSILICDGLIVLSGGIVFGIESMIYSLIILVLISYYSNRSMLGIGDDKVIFINSLKYQEIIKYLKDNYHYGITLFNALGGYSNKKRNVIMCSVRNKFYTEIKQSIFLIDPNAFISVYNSYETVYENKEERKKKRKTSLAK